jgi:pseudouridine-5'-phosphate glycosidase
MLSAKLLDVREDISAALRDNHPVVAMVSAPFSHTLPHPVNFELFEKAEAAVREEGAILALIAIWEGRLKVGLDTRQMDTLTRAEKLPIANRRELLTMVFRKVTGAASVSACMYIAQRAGLRLLSTGAIGGAVTNPTDVHDGRVWDVSPDLVELQYSPVAVVSAGARSVYHLGYTAEVLETFRVPVIGYQTDAFPTFYLRGGTYPTSARADTPGEVARLLNLHWDMDGAGIVIAQPTPAEVALSPDELTPALRAVEKQASEQPILRRDLSRTLMQRLNRLTHGKALIAYQTTFIANARLAAQIARERCSMAHEL